MRTTEEVSRRKPIKENAKKENAKNLLYSRQLRKMIFVL